MVAGFVGCAQAPPGEDALPWSVSAGTEPNASPADFAGQGHEEPSFLAATETEPHAVSGNDHDQRLTEKRGFSGVERQGFSSN